MKKAKKIFVLLFLALCLAVGTFGALSVSASDSASALGMSFTATKYFDQRYNISPSTGSITAEAEIWLDPNTTDSTTPDVIYGNYQSNTYVALDFLVRDGKYAELYTTKNGLVRFKPGYTTSTGNIVTLTDGTETSSSNSSHDDILNIRKYCSGTAENPVFCKIAVTVDTTSGLCVLYINGEAKASLVANGWKGVNPFANQYKSFRIGGDYRSGNSKYFNGQVKSVALYDVALSGEKIGEAVDVNDKNLLFAYDLTDTSKPWRLTDLSVNENHALNPNESQYSYPGLAIGRQEDDINVDYSDASYEIDKKFDSIPQTLEAWVYIPDAMSTSRVGVILGNYTGFALDSHLNFEVHDNCVPRIQWYDETGKGQYDIKFSNSKLSTEVWTHLALVYDNESGVTSCYVNGELSETKYFYPSIPESVLGQYYVLGGDTRTLNPIYFKGGLGDVSVYSDVRTAEEIKADYETGLAMTAADLSTDADRILYYDLDESDIGKNISDESGNGYHAFCSTTWLTEADLEEIRKGYSFDPAYSLAVIGDTQYTTRYFPDKLPVLYNWIKNNKADKNIQYVIGLGDITDANGKGTLATADKYSYVEDSTKPGGGYYVIDASGIYNEWDIAYHAITILDGVVEYSLIRGNHDMLTKGNGFNEYFAGHKPFTDQFIEQGGIYGYTGGEITDVTNTWRTMKIGNVNYLFMGLDYGASDDILSWASGVLSREEFKDYRVIISTHGYLYSDGTTLDLGDKHHPTPNSASETWTKFISKHANIQMVLCGHIYFNNILYNQRKGINGNTVTEMLIDPQAFDKKLEGLGIVAMFYFSEDGNDLAIEYYSTVRNKYFKTINQITLDVDAEGEDIEEPSGWLGNSIAPAGSGTEADPYLVSNGGNLLWMAEQVKTGTSATFIGKYFKQTADIDLCGFEIYSIGHYFGSESNMAAFGGHYNGNGYVIKNGTIEAYTKSNAFTTDYGYGLFGVIYGAVIENVTLDNVQIVGAGVTGAIVGRAASPLVSDSAFKGFNIISGCEVKDTVRIVTKRSSGTFTSYGFDNKYRAGRLGSICGMAYATVIDGCTSAASYTFTGDYGHVGGIVGTAGLNSEISNCVYSGVMTLYDNTALQTSIYGGIVGSVSPTTSWGSSYIGGIHIHDCYNKGTLTFGEIILNAGTFAKNTHWGGILGGANWLNYIEADPENDFYPYLIENCYNLANGPTLIEAAGSSKQVIGGIVGKSCPTKNATSAMFIRNCYSIDVQENGDSGTNEYRYQNNTPTKDTIDGTNLNGAHPLANVSTKTAAELEGYVGAVNTAIAAIRSSEIEAVWYGGSAAPTEKGNTNDKYFDSASMVYYEYDGNEWKLAGGFGNYLVTEYGVVPGTVVDKATTTPIALFKNGSFIGAYSVFSDGTDSGGAYAQAKALTDGNNDGEIGSEVQMFFMADASATGAFTNAGQILGKIVIDLNGHTLTQNYTSQSLFATVAKNWKGMDSATINVFDGSIVLKTNLLSFDGFGSGYQNTDGYKTFYLNFDNVSFSYAQDSSSANFLGLYGERVTSGKITAYEIEFNGCTFDFTNNSAISTVFNANDADIANCNSIVKAAVNGGEIITTNPSLKLYDEHATNGSSVVFAKNEKGAYTKMTVKGNGTYPAAAANGGELVFVKVSVTEDAITYALAPKALTFYVPQMSITLANNFIMNVYVPTNCTEEFTFNGVTYNADNSFGGNVVTIGEKNYYLVSVALGSSEAAKELKLAAKVNVNENTATATFTFSIPKYVTKVLANSNATEIEKTLAKDVLAYIKEAYSYFDTHNDAEEIARVNALVESIIGDYTAAPVSTGTTVNAAGVTEVTLNLDAKPTIRFYITDTTLEFSANGKKLNTVTGTDTKGTYVELDVYAYALCETINYTGGGSYHISSFVNGSVGTEYESLVKAFVKYVESAADYRESVIAAD